MSKPREYITPTPERADFQRPDISDPVDPRGGFTHSPEFVISGAIDNDNEWSSTKGNQRNRFATA